jgi:hypothetical protein
MPNPYAYRAVLRTWLGGDAAVSLGGLEFSDRAGIRGRRVAISPSDRRAGREAS